ncbi:MAG: DNA-3-methyladenine glycosylase [Bacteroidales bacterium]|nr:DNA-3-methyladenine glycosylase [Bacteroidales bacterium]
MKIGKKFFEEDDVVGIAKKLLGKVLCTQIGGVKTCGIISETEAYAGATDRASHAFNNRRTARTEVMFGSGGIAYIYLCYGIHHLFNFVTAPENIPHAVLLRGIFPLEGIEIMEYRRGKKFTYKGFSDGPGKASTCLGINTIHNGTPVTGNQIWVEDRGFEVNRKNIFTGKRIGVDYAGKDAQLPYRFLLLSNLYT